MKYDAWNPAQRKPDNHRVYRPIVKQKQKGKWWEPEERVEPPSIHFKWGEDEHRVHEWKNGILDHMFDWDGIEDEIERVNKKLGVE